MCQKLGLRFIAHNGLRHGGPDVQLKCPIFRNVSPLEVMVILGLDQYHMS